MKMICRTQSASLSALARIASCFSCSASKNEAALSSSHCGQIHQLTDVRTTSTYKPKESYVRRNALPIRWTPQRVASRPRRATRLARSLANRPKIHLQSTEGGERKGQRTETLCFSRVLMTKRGSRPNCSTKLSMTFCFWSSSSCTN